MIRVLLIGYDSLVYLIINQTCLTEWSCLISSYDHVSHEVASDYHTRVNHGYMSVTHIVCPACCQSNPSDVYSHAGVAPFMMVSPLLSISLLNMVKMDSPTECAGCAFGMGLDQQGASPAWGYTSMIRLPWCFEHVQTC